jgi:hypothetical protein
MDCSWPISLDAASCPRCGAPNPRKLIGDTARAATQLAQTFGLLQEALATAITRAQSSPAAPPSLAKSLQFHSAFTLRITSDLIPMLPPWGRGDITSVIPRVRAVASKLEIIVDRSSRLPNGSVAPWNEPLRSALYCANAICSALEMLSRNATWAGRP